MARSDPRALLERLIRERGEDYAGLSRLLGRNPAYVQQFIKRGTPRRLAEEDRRRLARYFGVGEALLGGSAPSPAGPGEGMVGVPRLDVAASAGPGALGAGDARLGSIAFDAGWLRRLGLTRSAAASLALLRVEGDSMHPTLSDGDEILVDRGDAGDRLREGIYVLRADDSLLVKRVAPGPGGRLSVRSDNPAFPDWEDVGADEIETLGRVVWVGRRLR